MIPHNPLETYQPDHKDYQRALQHMKSDEFLGLANQELTFAFSLNIRMVRVNARLLTLLDMIKTELEKFD